MCIICEIKQRGESIHRAMEELLEQKELEQSAIKAQVNLDNADAVNKLVRAAEALRETGEHAYANRVLLALDAILPKQEERRTGDTGTATPTEESKKASTLADPIRWAEGLIRQLPVDHDGRNSWLLNHGASITEEPPATNPVPVVDEFEGAPPQLKAYVEMMRKAGVKVEVVRLPL